MKSSIVPLALITVALAACSSTRETVVEKPVVSRETREIIVEKQTQLPQLPRSCAYGSNTYSSNSLNCQGGQQYQCVDGTWVGRNLVC